MSSICGSTICSPCSKLEVDNQSSILNLLKAYGEAFENRAVELAEVILHRIVEKSSLIGTTVERLAYYLFEGVDRALDSIDQESFQNYEVAFRAFYLTLPYGRFAQLTANMSILEAIPDDADSIHIIDFDICNGVQWPPVLEAVGCQRTLRLTSINWADKSMDIVPPELKFEETKRRLVSYAKYCGMSLKMKEIKLQDLVSELTNTKNMGRRAEWLAFNCMIALPHMGNRHRSWKQVKEFLKIAKEFTRSSNGIIAVGDGTGMDERILSLWGFRSFFGGYLLHSHALLESVELQFPSHLTEARIAIESLFIAPYISVKACLCYWEETKEFSSNGSEFGLIGLKLSKENLIQAQQIVQGCQYEVTVEGKNENVAVLSWRRTSLVKISTWI